MKVRPGQIGVAHVRKRIAVASDPHGLDMAMAPTDPFTFSLVSLLDIVSEIMEEAHQSLKEFKSLVKVCARRYSSSRVSSELS